MKRLIIFIVFFHSTLRMSSQADIQIVKVKHEDKSVSVYAVNNSNLVYTVKVDIALIGMKTESPIPSSIEVFPRKEKLVALLIPVSNGPSYKIHFKATALEDEEKITLDGDVPNLTIYTKNGQNKSTELRIYLKKNEIPFYEINTSYNEKSKEIFKKMLHRRGIKESDAKLPVVIIRGEAYYNIKDIKEFIKNHF